MVVVGLREEEQAGANVGRGVRQRVGVGVGEERKDGAVGKRRGRAVMWEMGVGVGSIKVGV